MAAPTTATAPPSAPDAWAKRWVYGLLATFVVSALVILCTSSMHDDENFYVYGIKLVGTGYLPYRDFYFNQTPLMLYVYAPLQWLFPGSMLALRLWTLCLGAATFAVLARVAWQRFGPAVAVLVLVFSLNAGLQYMFTIVKVYALGVFLVALCCWCLWPRQVRPWHCLAAGALMAAAILTRVAYLPGLPLVVLYLACRRDMPFNHWRAAGLAALGGGLVLVLGAGAFVWLAPHAFYTDVYAMNATAGLAAGDLGWRRQLWGLVPFVTKGLRDFGFVVASFVVLAGWLVHTWWRRGRGTQLRQVSADWLALMYLTLLSGLVLAVHLKRPFPFHEYVVVVVPLMALTAAVVWSWVWTALPRGGAQGVLLAVLLALQAGTWGSTWLSMLDLNGGRLPYARFRELATALHQQIGPGQLVYTAHPAVAFAAQAEVPRPMAFPHVLAGLAADEADRLHLPRWELVPGWLLDPRLHAAVLQEGDLAGLPADVRQVLDAHFQRLRVFPAVDLGLGVQPTYLYVRREGDTTGAGKAAPGG